MKHSTIPISVRLSDEELEQIETAAALKGMKRHRWLRSVLLRAVTRELRQAQG